MIPAIAPAPFAPTYSHADEAVAANAFEALMIQQLLASAGVGGPQSPLTGVALGALAGALAEARPLGLAGLLAGRA